MIQLFDIRIDEQTSPVDIDRALRNVRDAIRDLQRRSAPTLLNGIELTDGVATPVAHGQNRRVRVFVSPVVGASTSGRIEEVLDSGHDLTKFVVLKASGFGATVTVSLVVL